MLTTLTLLVWIADVIENIADYFRAIGGITAFLAVIGIVISFAVDIREFPGSDDNDRKKTKTLIGKLTVVCLVVGIVSLFVGNVIPSKRAVYMMTGIQMVDAFSKTEFVQEISGEGKQIVRDLTYRIHEFVGDGSKTAKDAVKDVIKEAVTDSTEKK